MGRVAPVDPFDIQLAEEQALGSLITALTYDPAEVIRPLPLTGDKKKEEAARLAGSLHQFIPWAWPLIEPNKFIANWHIDAIAEHLEAVSNGSIKDLLVTMPPRHSKSLIITVLWPVWEWLNLPSYRWVFASYAFSLSVRDSIKRRKIIMSPQFQELFADRFALINEQNTKIRYENNKNGFMLASSVGGSNTGEGGERIVADDPHNIKEAESEQVRQDTVNWWNIVMSTRRNDTEKSARIVVQQRVHEADVAGSIIEAKDYVHLNLPTEFGFAGAERCHTVWVDKATGEDREWYDPRIEEGELLNPERFDQKANDKAKLDLGDYQYAAQHGQEPAPPSGQIIKLEWLRYYGGKNQPAIPDWTKSTNPMTPLLSLDCTFKDHKDTDYVCGLVWVAFGADLYLMPQRIHARMSFTATVDAVAEFVGGKSLDGEKTYPGIYPFIKIKLVEDKANGTAIIDTLQHRIPGFVPFSPGNNGKEARMEAGSWRFRAGNIYLPDEHIAPWIVEYRYELTKFPKAKKDDYVDATSQAILWLGGENKVTGEPTMTTQASKWVGFGDFELGDSGSVWSAVQSGVGVGGGSIWRR